MHPVILQPGAAITHTAWMDKPSITISDIPPGLEYLVNIDYVRIRQLVEFLDTSTSLYVPNRYVVENSRGEQIYVTTEQPNSLRSPGKGPGRGYKFDMYDKFSRLAFRIERPEADECDCCSCCSLSLCCSCNFFGGSGVRSIVESPVGTLAGVLLSGPSLLSFSIGIRDGDGQRKLTVSSAGCCGSRFTKDAVDPVGRNQQRAAIVTRRFRGQSGASTSADVFEIKFHPEVDVRMKASVIGAAILLDFSHFEGGKSNR